ncbi:MAG: VOC family protein, partial [Bacteroidota bacterium]
DHIGIVVPDMEEAVQFFQELFGGIVIGQALDFKATDNWMQEHLRVHPRAVIEKIVVVQLFDQTTLELFQYNSPNQVQQLPKNSDYGATHLAFEVKDLQASIADLQERNIPIYGHFTFNDPAWENISGALENLKWVYFESPWGMSIELVEKIRP